MNARRILVPIDIAKCPLEVFARINAFAQGTAATVILLHVVNLNLATPDRRIDQEVCEEARGCLARLARNYVGPGATVLTHVRMGKPVEEILAEAEAENVDLIILPVFATAPHRRGHLRRWFSAAIWPGMVKRLIHSAQCALLIVHEEASFNCERNWGQPLEQLKPACYDLHPTIHTYFPPEAQAVAAQAERRAA